MKATAAKGMYLRACEQMAILYNLNIWQMLQKDI